MKTFFREVLLTVVLAVAIFLGLRAITDTVDIPSSSMVPTLQIGQRLIILKVVYLFQEPERGDVITFHPPHKPKGATPFIKRIIALPGETVEIKDGAVYIDGRQLDEPYIKSPPTYTYSEHKIPEGEYFVLGDNRNNSEDSHTGYTVPRENIIGKAWLSIWPPNEWGVILSYADEME